MGTTTSNPAPLAPTFQRMSTWEFKSARRLLSDYKDKDLDFGLDASGLSEIVGGDTAWAEEIIDAFGGTSGMCVLERGAPETLEKAGLLFDALDFDATEQISMDEMTILFLCGARGYCVMSGVGAVPSDEELEDVTLQAYRELSKPASQSITKSEFTKWVLTFLAASPTAKPNSDATLEDMTTQFVLVPRASATSLAEEVLNEMANETDGNDADLQASTSNQPITEAESDKQADFVPHEASHVDAEVVVLNADDEAADLENGEPYMETGGFAQSEEMRASKAVQAHEDQGDLNAQPAVDDDYLDAVENDQPKPTMVDDVPVSGESHQADDGVEYSENNGDRDYETQSDFVAESSIGNITSEEDTTLNFEPEEGGESEDSGALHLTSEDVEGANSVQDRVELEPTAVANDQEVAPLLAGSVDRDPLEDTGRDDKPVELNEEESNHQPRFIADGENDAGNDGIPEGTTREDAKADTNSIGAVQDSEADDEADTKPPQAVNEAGTGLEADVDADAKSNVDVKDTEVSEEPVSIPIVIAADPKVDVEANLERIAAADCEEQPPAGDDEPPDEYDAELEAMEAGEENKEISVIQYPEDATSFTSPPLAQEEAAVSEEVVDDRDELAQPSVDMGDTMPATDDAYETDSVEEKLHVDMAPPSDKESVVSELPIPAEDEVLRDQPPDQEAVDAEATTTASDHSQERGVSLIEVPKNLNGGTDQTIDDINTNAFDTFEYTEEEYDSSSGLPPPDPFDKEEGDTEQTNMNDDGNR